MENHKEEKGRPNPKINDNPDVMNALIKSAIYYIERGETDFYIWAKKIVKEVGDESIRPFLHKAWREAKKISANKSSISNDSSLKSETKEHFLYLKQKALLNFKIIKRWLSGNQELRICDGRFFNIDARLNADDLLLYDTECDHKILLREHCIQCKEKVDKVKKLIKNYDIIRKHNLKYMLGGFDSSFTDNFLVDYATHTLSHIQYFIKEMNLQKNQNILEAIESFDDIRQNAQRKKYSLTEQKTENYDSKDIQEEVCFLTKQQCEYYDSKDNACYYGKEGIESWKAKICPKKL
ncbi:MAG TPA: hypothetical protein VJ348_01650 [Candidatus Humimicrobiaceae bacterium]|nr:hypothetical protein [Candidatus Humimicrobiaceae bacterium]